MENDREFALPGSGYDVLKKILHAYVLCGEKDVSLAEVSQKAGMNKTMVSCNNGFFASVGIIKGGRKKTLTPEGRKLAIATSHADQEATATAWLEIISNSKDLRGVIEMIKVQNGIAQSNLPAKIASHFGLPGGKGATGLNAIIGVLVDVGVIVTDGDKYVVAVAPTPKEQPASATNAAPKNGNEEAAARATSTAAQAMLIHPERGGPGTPMVPIHINIELHLPGDAEQGAYDAIFKSIRQDLMEPVDGLSDAG